MILFQLFEDLRFLIGLILYHYVVFIPTILLLAWRELMLMLRSLRFELLVFFVLILRLVEIIFKIGRIMVLLHGPKIFEEMPLSLAAFVVDGVVVPAFLVVSICWRLCTNHYRH